MEPMRRKAYDEMLRWKAESGRTALAIDGARRVGKSFLAEQFGMNEYRSYLLIDFSDVDEEVKGYFRDSSRDMDLFFTKLSFHFDVELHPRESLIIFDEVQFFPYARQKIKKLVADGRFDYIETGSLLSINEFTKDILLPSEEHHMTLHPMDFEEFLWAIGDTTTAPYLRTCLESRTPLGESGHRKVMDLFRQYMVVGGMPDAVGEYVTSKDLGRTDRIKGDILELYRTDISKFAGAHKKSVQELFDSIPSQLARKNKRMSPGIARKGSRSRDYEDAFMWIGDSMVANLCFNATDPGVGLRMYEERTTLKMYMGDTGLLVTMAMSDGADAGQDYYRDIILDRMEVNEGMFMENVVAQSLVAGGRDLYFYSRSDPDTHRNSIEIDFLIRKGGRICPVEVKSGRRIQHASLDRFVERFGDRIGQPCVLCTRDLYEKDGVLHLPLYMAMLLRRRSRVLEVTST